MKISNNETRPSNPDNWLTTCQAARFLKCAPGTLANKRVTGDGPPFIKYGGSVYYALDALKLYLNQEANTTLFISSFGYQSKKDNYKVKFSNGILLSKKYSLEAWLVIILPMRFIRPIID